MYYFALFDLVHRAVSFAIVCATGLLSRPVSAHAPKFLVSLAAVFGYGGWAYFSNCFVEMNNAEMVALRAAIIQGSYAGLLTLINVVVLEGLFLWFNDKLSCLGNMLTTVSCATAMQYSIIVPVHLLNGTPNILLTLAPGLVIGTLFSSGYVYSVKNRYYPPTPASGPAPAKPD